MTTKRRLLTAATQGASAVPESPVDQGALPVPAQAPEMPVIANMQASNNGHTTADQDAPGLEFSAGDLVRGLPDPKLDLVTVAVRIPRVLAEALDIESRLTRRPRQAIVSDSLWASMSPRLVDDVHRRIYGRPLSR